MKRTLFILLCILGSTLYGGSIRIINDTTYTLTAHIHSADGSNKGAITLSPQTISMWQDAIGGSYTWSQTPYRVTFYCTKSSNQYGVIDDISQAATIRASMASGPRICKEPKKDRQNKEKQNNNSNEGNNSSPQGQNIEPPGDPNWGPP